jgi:hypothetical protein
VIITVRMPAPAVLVARRLAFLLAIGQPEHPQRVARHAVVLAADGAPLFITQRHQPAAAQHAGAALEHVERRALDRHQVLLRALAPVQRGHPAAGLAALQRAHARQL